MGESRERMDRRTRGIKLMLKMETYKRLGADIEKVG